MLHKNWVVLTPILLIFSLGSGEAQTTSPFPDVPTNHWAYSAMVDLHKRGILVGYPKEYDNSTPEACWKSIVKAMERGNEKVLRELMFDDAWKEYTSGKSVRAERLAFFRRVASYYLEREREGAISWKPAEVLKGVSYSSFAMEKNLNRNGMDVFGPGPTIFILEKGKSGWKLVGRQME